ncbi:hypothetical protein FSP39_009701 [Pinctada imbricata]|uniref:TatD n=1 Tax=Pinctada imbricata TaxID=66713 RepID=A0AA88YLC9_PINIB|nr:hypothetical protein FSP39_009701 [Pinctada imbricata]
MEVSPPAQIGGIVVEEVDFIPETKVDKSLKTLQSFSVSRTPKSKPTVERQTPSTSRPRQPMSSRVVVPGDKDIVVPGDKDTGENKRTLSITFNSSSKSGRKSDSDLMYCPLSSCDSTDKRLRRHVNLHHFPVSLTAVASNREELRNQVRALRHIVLLAFGERATLQDAVSWINRNGKVPRTISLNPLHCEMLGEACRVMGIKPPEEFTLHPINSPAVLLFWRCILAMLTRCNPGQLRDIYYFERPGTTTDRTPIHTDLRTIIAPPSELVREPNAKGKRPMHTDLRSIIAPPQEPVREPFTPDADDSDDVGDLILLDEVGGSDDDEEETVAPVGQSVAGLPQVFDSHFHLDRSSMKIWRTYHGHTVEDLIAHSGQKPSVKVNVVGGIIVYSEPRSYPEVDFQLHGPWRVAVGVHPKHHDSLTNDKKMILHRLLSHPKVVALGECGLDRTVPVSEWSHQEDVFRRMLQLARVDQPLVVHLRGPIGDEYGSDVHCRCVTMMESLCDKNQLVHVHCFTGKAEIVEVWNRKFPRTYFGVTAAIRTFTAEQINGLIAIPMNKLLLESDAPYFPLGNATVSSPAFLGEVAAILAVHLDRRPQELMQATLTNAKVLYRM